MSGFKYRTWDKQAKVMEQYHYLQLSPNGQLYHDGMNVTDKYEILRFTGLKDKNGKEVYEGDILKEKDIITEVVFHDYQWKEKLIRSPRNHLKNYFPFRDTLPFTAEVLGNIYDNPELLKK
ncbi:MULTISPECIES: YopX family protein [Bacillus cereus group]|uniref:YopX family protein n=1 Tax=Bacillus cereus group TaxID=86661 RepID=UPI001F5749E7|nr:YopX family protein [Bacillus cereus group sp. BfR-BA-01381]